MDRTTQIILNNVLTVGICVFVMACGGSKETEKRTHPTSDNSNKYEDEFRPSDYDIDAKIFFSELRKENEKKAVSTEPVVTESPTVVAGFRVQLFATEEIDVANAKKAAAEAEFPEELFYIAYDPPTYKLRTGNFLNRADADAYAKILSERGYPDAWVVPERVFKNPPPRPTSQPQEQQPPKQ